MEDNKKNKERKVLTDEELEQVSGGRVVFDINTAGIGCDWKYEEDCLKDGCTWDGICQGPRVSKSTE